MTTVAYLGPEHTNTHLAALKRFGRRARYVHAPTVDDVFAMVERRKAAYGVVPVENSLEGAVTHTLDRFVADTPLKIVGEIERPIQHHLIVRPGARLSDIERVYSHPQALAQCRRWISTHLAPSCELSEMSSTAEAVRNLGARQTYGDHSRTGKPWNLSEASEA
jgi:chorismate mutase/prephenate dehydratase